MSGMEDYGGKENDDIPWGKYTYSLEGLAKECYLEGAVNVDLSQRPSAPAGKRLRFRVELPERCFILSIAIKLPNAPEVALRALDDVSIERTLRSAEYEMIHDGVLSARAAREAPDGTSPTAVDATAQHTPRDNPRKKILEIRRAADSLRITLADIDPPANDEKMRDVTDSESDTEGKDAGEIRKLGVAVVGYVRGQTPVSSRIKILLSSSTRLVDGGSLADRAELDGLLGLAFLGNKRYRQAGELLERASNYTRQVALGDQKRGFAGELGFTWAAELNLLAAHAYFEHEPRANDGIARLVDVVASTRPRASATNPADIAPRSEPTEFLDLRTELLRVTQPLMEKLVQFLGESSSLAVQMASARMIEFVGQQLGCAIAPYIGNVLDQVLRGYPECKPLGARDKAAAASFSYDSMEDCYEKLVDICCRLLPLTEHSVLQRILEHTLMPVLHDGFDESQYILDTDNVEDDADEVLCQAVAQTLRLIYLVLTILGGDANVPPSFMSKLLDMLVADDGPRTPMLLRRSALHSWDAMSRSVVQSSSKKSAKEYKEYIAVQTAYMPHLLKTRRRRPFEYLDGEDCESGFEMRKLRVQKSAEFSKTLLAQLEKQNERVEIVDRHSLRRLLSFMSDTFSVLVPLSNEDERHTAAAAVSKLVRVLNEASGDLFLSSLMDISYFLAVSANIGPNSNLDYIEYNSFSQHMHVCVESLGYLLECYWAAIRLLPSRSAEDLEKKSIARSLLTWCVAKMREAAPPRDMLRLILVVVRGFQTEASVTFKQEYKLKHEVTPLELYRANNQWLAVSAHEEALDLHDTLCPTVAKHLTAKDILDAISGLGEQDDGGLDFRRYSSAEVLASVVSNTFPANPEATKMSLADVADRTLDEPRIIHGFPKSSGGNRSVVSRKLRFSAAPTTDNDPMAGSLYVHVVLASCFDKFEGLNKTSKRKGGGLTMGHYLDSFIEHAAFLVRCLVQCAKLRKHREYIGHTLGDVLQSCLNMQHHGDGRVRLAGFEIFACALNVLFLTENTGTQQGEEVIDLGTSTVIERMGSVSIASAPANATPEVKGAVKELNSGGMDHPSSPMANGKKLEGEKDEEQQDDEKLAEIFANGGSCTFFSSNASSSSDITFEERGWNMLCTFMSSSLGIGKYPDLSVHRACLEYLRVCILDALRGKSTGASVISFYHVEAIWEAVLRLVGSPVHSMNALALWVICATINVGVYSAVMAKGRGESRQKAAQLEEFVMNRLFVTAENFIKGGSKEMRLWGGRLLEVYIRARSMNPNSLEICPPPSKKVLLALQKLQNDWCEEARTLAKSLLSMHLDIPVKKPTTPSSSFTDRATTFLSNRRFGAEKEAEEQEPNGNQSSIELWFPPLPTVSPTAHMERFGKTLEAFANAEVAGGEEVDVADSDVDQEESEYDDGESVDYENEEGEYGLDDDNFGRQSSLDEEQNGHVEGGEEELGEQEYEEHEDEEHSEEEIPPEDDKDSSLGVVPEPSNGDVRSGAAPEPEPVEDNVVPMDTDDELAFTPAVFEKSPEAKKTHSEPIGWTKPLSPEVKKPEVKAEFVPSKEPEKVQKVEKPSKEPEKIQKAEKPKASSSAKAEKPKKLERQKSEKFKVTKEEKPPKRQSSSTFPSDKIDGVDNNDLELKDIDDLDEFGLGGLGAIPVEDHEEEIEIDLNDTGFERMPSLPRVGSFTGRKPQDISGEGEGIRLERRKSLDVGSLYDSSASRKRSDEDFDQDGRVRGSSLRHVSSISEGRFAGREMTSSNSFKSSHGSPKEGSQFLPRQNSRVRRGVKLDDDEEQQPPSASRSASRPNIDELRKKFESNPNRSPTTSGQQHQSQQATSKGRRSLPRVPAFNKPQNRRPSGGGDSPVDLPSSGSSRSRNSVHRTRSAAGRSSRALDDAGRRPERARPGPSDDGEPAFYRSASEDGSRRGTSEESRRRARRINSDELLPKEASKDRDDKS